MATNSGLKSFVIILWPAVVDEGEGIVVVVVIVVEDVVKVGGGGNKATAADACL